jgi:hypothetical protein
MGRKQLIYGGWEAQRNRASWRKHPQWPNFLPHALPPQRSTTSNRMVAWDQTLNIWPFWDIQHPSYSTLNNLTKKMPFSLYSSNIYNLIPICKVVCIYTSTKDWRAVLCQSTNKSWFLFSLTSSCLFSRISTMNIFHICNEKNKDYFLKAILNLPLNYEVSSTSV